MAKWPYGHWEMSRGVNRRRNQPSQEENYQFELKKKEIGRNEEGCRTSWILQDETIGLVGEIVCYSLRQGKSGTSLVVQGLGLRAPNAGVPGSTPD